MRVLGGEQQRCPCFEECQEYQKLLELRDFGLVIYCHKTCKENIRQGGAVESAVNTPRDVFIIHNKKDVKITTSQLTSELGKIHISCPRCRKIFEHAKELMQEVNSIERNVIMGICDHCRKKAQTIKNQYCACDEIVKKFRSVKGEQKGDVKKYIKIWLSKMKHLLKDDKTLNKPKQIKSRAYSDWQINRDPNSPTSSHEPEIQQMFKSDTNLNAQMRQTDDVQDYLIQGITFALPIEPVPTTFAHTSDTTFMETYEGIKELPRTSLKDRKQEEIFVESRLRSRPSMEAKEELKRRHDFSLRHSISFEKDTGVPFSVSKRPDVYETPKIAPWKQKEPTPKYHVESEMDIKIKTKQDLGSWGLKLDSQGAKSKSWQKKAPEPKETGLKAPFSFIFPKVMKKEEKNIQLNLSSSHLIKFTKEKFRLQTEKERQEKEHQQKEKQLEAEEKKKQVADDKKKYKDEHERPLIDKEEKQDKALALIRDKSEEDIFDKYGKLKGKRDTSKEDIIEKDGKFKGKRDKSKEDVFEKDGKLKGKRDESKEDIFEKDGTLKGERLKSKEDIFEKDGKLKGKRYKSKEDIFEKGGKLNGKRDKPKEDIFETDRNIKGNISKEFEGAHKVTKSEPHRNKIDTDPDKAIKDMKSKRDKEYLQKTKHDLKSTFEQGDKVDELTQIGKKDLKSKPEALDKTKKDVRRKSELKEKGDEDVIESGEKDVKEKSKDDDLISKAMKYHKRKSETRDKEEDIKETGKKGLALKTQAAKESGQLSKEKYLQKNKNDLMSTFEQGDTIDELTQIGKKDLKSKPEAVDKTKKDVRRKSELKEKGDEDVIESREKDVQEKSKDDDLISKAMKYHKRKSETREDIKETGKKGLALKTQAAKESGQLSKEKYLKKTKNDLMSTFEQGDTIDELTQIGKKDLKSKPEAVDKTKKDVRRKSELKEKGDEDVIESGEKDVQEKSKDDDLMSKAMKYHKRKSETRDKEEDIKDTGTKGLALKKQAAKESGQLSKEIDTPSKKGKSDKIKRDATGDIEVPLSKIIIKKETVINLDVNVKIPEKRQTDIKETKETKEKYAKLDAEYKTLLAERLKEKEALYKKKQLEYEAKAKELEKEQAKRKTVPSKGIKTVKMADSEDERDRLLKLCYIKQAATMKACDITPEILRRHNCHHGIDLGLFCPLCYNSELELDVISLENKRNAPKELIEDVIKGEKIFKIKRLLEKTKEPEVALNLYQTIFFEPPGELVSQGKPAREQSKILTKSDTQVETDRRGILCYALSDRTFIEKGWTVLPTEKVVRKMNVYRMRPAHPEFDWFEHNKNKRLMNYDTGEKLAEFDDNGRGRWYYRNGRLALDYYDAEETNAQQRFVVYSSGEPDERGRTHPITILATFDYLGNGIVFDHAGKIRLKYNQTEGVVLDRTIGPVSYWKWHSLNDPPVLQQVMIDTHMAHKDPNILKLGAKETRPVQPANEEMIAIEFENFIKEKSKKLSQKFKPFQIKMKALKINEHFSLRVLDQASVYLIFRDGSTNLKLNMGMILDHKEIVDTDTSDLGEVSNNLERFPARTDSLAGLQRSVAYAQRYERQYVERQRWLRPPEPCASADQLTAATSAPIRLPLRTLPTRSTCSTGYCSRKPPNNLYYNTRL